MVYDCSCLARGTFIYQDVNSMYQSIYTYNCLDHLYKLCITRSTEYPRGKGCLPPADDAQLGNSNKTPKQGSRRYNTSQRKGARWCRISPHQTKGWVQVRRCTMKSKVLRHTMKICEYVCDVMNVK